MNPKDIPKDFFDDAKEFFILEKGYKLKSQTKENIVFKSQKKYWSDGSILLCAFGIILFLFYWVVGIILIILSVILYFGEAKPTIKGSKIGEKIAWQGNSDDAKRAVIEFHKK